MAVTVTLEDLLEAGAHFGHSARRWNPKMAPYLYGVKEGVHIFDLAKTKEALDEALEVINKYAKEGKVILLVGTKKQAKDAVKALGERVGQPYINERWLGGTLTNFNQVLNSVRKLKDIEEGLTTGKFTNYTKKEKLLLEREAAKLRLNFGGLVNLASAPDLIVIIDTHKEASAVREATKLNIPTVGITDSNADPLAVTYPIPMNDDASKSLEYILAVFEKALTTKGETKAKVKTAKETKKTETKKKEK